MSCLLGDFGVRYSVPVSLEGDFGVRFSIPVVGVTTVPLEGSHGTRFTTYLDLEGDFGFRFPVIPTQIWNFYVVPSVSAVAEENRLYRKDFGYSIVLHDVAGAVDLDLTPYVQSGDIQQKLSNPSSLTLTLVNEDRIFRPKLDPLDTYYQLFDGDTYDQNWNLRRYITVTIYCAGSSWIAPWYLIDTFDWSLNSSGETICTLECTDITEKLLNDDQQLEDYLSVTGSGGANIYSSNGIMASIASHYKIKYRISSNSFLVRQFSPKGSQGMEYFRKLLYVTQGQWYTDRDTLVLEPLMWYKTGVPTWGFEDIYDIKNIKYKKSIQGLKNEFVINKVEKAGTPLARVEVHKYGITDFIELQDPSYAIDVRVIEARHGSMTYFIYYDAQKNPIATTSGSFRHGINAKYVRFNYDPGLSIGGDTLNFFLSGAAFDAYGVVEFWGVVRPTSFGVFDEGYKILYKAPNQTRFGPRRDMSPVENSLIPDKSSAITLATRLADVSLRMTQISNWEGVLNPWVIPGRTIGIICGQAGFTTMTNFYVESISKKFNNQGSFTMEIECTGDQA